MTAALWTSVAQFFPFFAIPRPSFVDEIFRRVKSAEENRLAARRVIDHLDMIASRGRCHNFLCPRFSIPFPGLLIAFTEVNRSSSIQDKHISLFIVGRSSKDTRRRTTLCDSLPLHSIPAPDRERCFLTRVFDAVNQEQQLQLRVIDQIRFPARRRIFKDWRGSEGW